MSCYDGGFSSDRATIHDCCGKAGSRIPGKFSGLHGLLYVDSYGGSYRESRKIFLDRERNGGWVKASKSTTSYDDDAVALVSKNNFQVANWRNARRVRSMILAQML
jgi:hypothetical protein